MKIVLVANNKNNRLARVLPGLEQQFRQADLGEVQFLQTLRRKHAIELSRQAARSGCDYLIAVGGDGTLNEVLNGLMQSNLPTNAYPAIGLLSYGSANDFARTANISRSMDSLVDLIRTKSIQKVDLAKIILHETGEIHYFINVAGVGLGAEVAQNLAGSSSALGPGFHYFKHILKGFLKYSKKHVRCTGSTWQWKGPLLQLAVGNGRYFGHGICIAPDASITDGQLQVAIFGDLRIWDYLNNIRNLKKGVKINHPQVRYQTTRELLIESEDPCGIEADGEYVGLAPATITVLPKVIRFLLPPWVE